MERNAGVDLNSLGALCVKNMPLMVFSPLQLQGLLCFARAFLRSLSSEARGL
jgi:hypothetical protein